MKIDLSTGKIDAFNFSLVSSRVKLSTSGTVTKPYLEIVGNDITLMHISEAGQYIRSNNFSDAKESGMEINLGSGDFTAYTFELKAGNSTEGFLRMSSTGTGGNGYPLWLGTSLENAKFKVDWAGNLTCDGLAATNGNFSGQLNGATGTFTGTVSAGTISSSKITGGSISIGSNFSVNSNGDLTANNGEFTGTITASNISAGGGEGASAGYSLTSAGVLSATGVDLTGKISAETGHIGEWYINTALTSSKDGSGIKLSVSGVTATDYTTNGAPGITSASWGDIVKGVWITNTFAKAGFSSVYAGETSYAGV
jgi:hypothetical protein